MKTVAAGVLAALIIYVDPQRVELVADDRHRLRALDEPERFAPLVRAERYDDES